LEWFEDEKMQEYLNLYYIRIKEKKSAYDIYNHMQILVAYLHIE